MVITAVQIGEDRCWNRYYNVKEGMEMRNSSLVELIRLKTDLGLLGGKRRPR